MRKTGVSSLVRRFHASTVMPGCWCMSPPARVAIASSSSSRMFMNSKAGDNSNDDGGLSYSERQAKMGRPLSSHVTTYAFPMAAISSITIRTTGVALTAGLYSIGGAALLGMDVGGMVSSIGSTPFIAPLAKASVTFPLVYHYLGAVRHALWDYFPETVHNESAEKSSYAMFGVSGLAAILGAIV